MRVMIATPSLVPHDAVSNDVLQQARLLSDLDMKVGIYAEFCHPSLKDKILSRAEFASHLGDPDGTLIIHHSVFWPEAEQLLQIAYCRIFLKYHNITPSNFFSYDSLRVHMTTEGRRQTKRMVESGKINLYLSDSNYNAAELIADGAPPYRVKVIAPFHRVHDFDDSQPDEETLASLRDGNKHVLFVGRVAPNKGHLHLVRTLAEYIRSYGSAVRLHVIGGINPGDGPYLSSIEETVRNLKLDDYVIFHDKVNFSQIQAYYQGCDSFLLMSEHEGFCVPILEAQYHKLPIVAWRQTAVDETLGDNQLGFKNLDYGHFSTALYRVMHDPELEEFLGIEGSKNFAKYEASELLRLTLEALNDSK